MDFITFKPDFLRMFNNLKERKLEQYEGIELLWVLEIGFIIGTIKMLKDSFSINTKEDFKKSISLMKKNRIRKLY